MGILNQEVFVELCSNDESFRAELSSAMGLGYYNRREMAQTLQQGNINREAALEVYAYAREYLVSNGFYDYKALRPWDWDRNALTSLDPNQAWWGFEFETGYESEEDRATMIRFAWDAFDGMCFDAEGEGGVYSEVTFSPAERSKFLDGTADAFKFMQYLNDNPQLVNNTGYSMVGTHLNLSVPWARNNPTKNRDLEYLLNNTLHKIPFGRYTYFGRETLYGGAFDQGTYVELKLFRTTYSMEQFQRYIKSADALTRIALAAESLEGSLLYTYCSNFAELWNNPEAVPVFETDTSLLTSNWDQYVSGSEFCYEDEDLYDDEEENW